MVPYCLVPGPWVIRVGNNGLECDGLIKEMVGCRPWIGWPVFESALVGKLSALSGKWLILRGAVPPGSARLQMSKHQKIENMVNIRKKRESNGGWKEGRNFCFLIHSVHRVRATIN